jgi:hypothetical protein
VKHPTDQKEYGHEKDVADRRGIHWLPGSGCGERSLRKREHPPVAVFECAERCAQVAAAVQAHKDRGLQLCMLPVGRSDWSGVRAALHELLTICELANIHFVMVPLARR